jgi:hypothetical protein
MPTLQLAVPILLILWFAVAPLRGQARIAHAAMLAGLIAVMTLALPWHWPSAYAPLALALLLILAIAFGRRRPADRRNPRLWPGLLATVVAIAATAGSVWLVAARLRPADVQDIALPFATAAAVTEGGTHALINRHARVLDPDSPSLSGWQGAARAATLRPVDALGRPLPTVQTVLAPCAGSVQGQGADTRLGRYLVLECGALQVVLSGLETVTATGTVALHQAVGTASQLTLHAQGPGTPVHPFAGTPEWISLNGTFPVRGWVIRP